MRTRLLFALIIQLYFAGMAQAQVPYSFSSGTETYTEFSGGTAISGITPAIPLPFSFAMGSQTNDSIFLLFQNIKLDNNGYSPTFTAFGAELVNGERSYEVTGSAGQRILKVQFRNMNFAHDFNVTDFINYQVWFYEADNGMEVHFGSSNIQNPQWSYYYNESGPYIGIYMFANALPCRLVLTGDPASPVADTALGLRLTGTPPDGQVYRFAPNTTNVSYPASTISKIFPNPSQGKFFIQTTTANTVDMRIYNLAGQIVFTQPNTRGNSSVETNLSPGMYMVEMVSEKERWVEKLVVE